MTVRHSASWVRAPWAAASPRSRPPAEFETILVKATPGALDGARRYMAESLGRAVKKGKLTAEALDDDACRG